MTQTPTLPPQQRQTQAGQPRYQITSKVIPEALQHYVYTLAYPEGMGGYVFYVGKGVGYRIDNHEREARRGVISYKCRVIRKIWRTGGEVVKTKMTFFATHKEALLFEQALIILMRPYGYLTNLTDGGEGTLGWVPDEEYRRKISEKRKGKKLSEEHRFKISEASKKRWSFEEGEEAKRRLIEANKTRIWSEEARSKLSEARKGKTLSEEHRRKLSEVRKGKVLSEEHRRKLSEARKGQSNSPHSEEHRRKNSEGLKRYYAQQRAQALARMCYPVISSTDSSWKQGVIQTSLWEVGA